MKTKCVLLILLIMVGFIGCNEASAGRCRRRDININNYNSIEAGEHFPLYVGAEFQLLPIQWRSHVLTGVTGAYYTDTLDIGDFDGGHMALITVHVDPWAIFSKKAK